MSWTAFYFNKLPNFVNILKRSLSEQLDKNNDLSIVDYTKIFFDFFYSNNAFYYFKNFNPTGDKMYLSIDLGGHESKIYMERDIRIEDEDGEFQIQFELILDIPSIESRMQKTFEVKRDILGDFSNWEEGYFYFEDFHEKVISDSLILNLLNLKPKSIRIDINADI